MDVQFTLSIEPHLLEQVLASFIVVAMLIALAFIVRKFIGE